MTKETVWRVSGIIDGHNFDIKTEFKDEVTALRFCNSLMRNRLHRTAADDSWTWCHEKLKEQP